MKQLFISYSRENKAVVDELTRLFPRLGYQSWVDSTLHGGQSWWDEILEQIANCDAFVAVVSRESLNSVACQRELKWALDLGKPVLPVAVGHAERLAAALPQRLALRQILDWSAPDMDASIELAGALFTLPPAPALPEILPPRPPAPLSYMTQLADSVDAETLDQQEQASILDRLEQALSSSDEGEREGAQFLIEKFGRRGDLDTDVEERLAAMGIAVSHPRLLRRQFSAAAESQPAGTESLVRGDEPVATQELTTAAESVALDETVADDASVAVAEPTASERPTAYDETLGPDQPVTFEELLAHEQSDGGPVDSGQLVSVDEPVAYDGSMAADEPIAAYESVITSEQANELGQNVNPGDVAASAAVSPTANHTESTDPGKLHGDPYRSTDDIGQTASGEYKRDSDTSVSQEFGVAKPLAVILGILVIAALFVGGGLAISSNRESRQLRESAQSSSAAPMPSSSPSAPYSLSSLLSPAMLACKPKIQGDEGVGYSIAPLCGHTDISFSILYFDSEAAASTYLHEKLGVEKSGDEARYAATSPGSCQNAPEHHEPYSDSSVTGEFVCLSYVAPGKYSFVWTATPRKVVVVCRNASYMPYTKALRVCKDVRQTMWR